MFVASLAPGGGHLDVVLLEDRLALLVVDDRGAQLPGDLVEGVPSRGREVSAESQARAFFRCLRRAGLGSLLLHGMSRHRYYLTSR